MITVLLSVLLLVSLVGCSEKSEMDQFTGEWTEEGYRNEKLGINFITPEGATVITKDELKAEEDALHEGKTKEELETLKKTKKLFYASYPGEGVSIYIYVENLAGKEILDVAKYLEQAQLYYSQDPMVVPIFGEIYPSTIGDHEYSVLPFEISGTDYVQMLYARSEGDYVITYMISYIKGNERLAVKLLQAFEGIQE